MHYLLLVLEEMVDLVVEEDIVLLVGLLLVDLLEQEILLL